MKRRGRKAATELVYNTLEEAISANCSKRYTPYRVSMLGQVKICMASSSSNAVSLTAYALGAKAEPIGVREAVQIGVREAVQAALGNQHDPRI